MRAPIEIASRDFPLAPWWRERIERKAEKLERASGRITWCRAVVESRARHAHKGRLFNVRVDVGLPGALLTVDRETAPTLDEAIERSFDALERRLEDRARRRRDRARREARA